MTEDDTTNEPAAEGDSGLLQTIEDTRKHLAVSRSKVYELLRRNELEGVNVDRSRRVVVNSRKEYVKRLRAATRTPA